MGGLKRNLLSPKFRAEFQNTDEEKPSGSKLEKHRERFAHAFKKSLRPKHGEAFLFKAFRNVVTLVKVDYYKKRKDERYDRKKHAF